MPAERRAHRARSEDSKKLGRRNCGNKGFDDDDEESGKSGEDAVPPPLKRAEQRARPSPEDAGVQSSGESSPARGGVALKTKTTPSKRAKKSRPASQAEDSTDASLARGAPLPNDSADVGHANKKSAATPKRGEKRSPPPLQEEERPEKRAAGPDVASSAPKRNKKKKNKKKKKQLRKALAKPTSPPRPPPQEDEHHGREMAEQEPSNTSPPQDERRAREEEQQEKKTAEQEQEQHGQEQNADGTSLTPPSPRLTLGSDPEPMGFWGVEVKPREPYAHKFSGRVRITQATLGNLESVDGSTIECSVNGRSPVKFCALNSTSVMYRLELEYGKGENVVFSVVGDSSVHLAGHYKTPVAAANVQALATQIQEADDRKTTHVHGTAQEYNALDTEVHDDGTTQLVGKVGLNAAANVQVLVTQSQEAGHRSTNKEAIDELEIQELKSGDCNAEIASDGKKVKVEYIGRLKDGKVVDAFEGGPAIHTFTLGAGRVIAGWDQGIKGMRVGEKRKLTIPPALAYKDEPQKESQMGRTTKGITKGDTRRTTKGITKGDTRQTRQGDNTS